MKTFVIIFVAVLAVVGLGFYLFQSSSQQNPTDLPGQLFDNLGQDHITQGSTEHPAYNSNPPTSGWHWPTPANWGIYKSEVPDEQLIHNLEHGGIWISYKPDANPELVAQLEDFAKRYRKIIVEPRAQNDSPIALAAWTRLQKLDNYDEQTILKFIEAHYDNGPEKVP